MAFLKPNPNNSGMRGRMAGQVYTGGGEDTIVRSFVKPTQNDTPAKLAAEAAFTRGSQGWALLTLQEQDSWNRLAKGVKSKNPKRIRQVGVSGFNLFLGYCAKYLQLHPGSSAPKFAPTSRFAGDDLAFTVVGDDGRLLVTADKANRTGVTTEILIQPLTAAYRKPSKQYDHAAFYVYASSPLVAEIDVPLGAYSVAVQYVETASGAVSGYQVLGTATVLTMVAGGRSEEGEGLRAA